MLGFIALLGSLWMAPPCETAACSCVGPRPVSVSLGQADAVFSGRVVRVRTVMVDDAVGGRRHMRRATLRVDRAWKGVDSRTVVVITGMGGGDCGYDFRRRQSYLVFAHRAGSGALHTGICGRTSALARASAVVNELGQPARRWPR